MPPPDATAFGAYASASDNWPAGVAATHRFVTVLITCSYAVLLTNISAPPSPEPQMPADEHFGPSTDRDGSEPFHRMIGNGFGSSTVSVGKGGLKLSRRIVSAVHFLADDCEARH